MDGDFSFGFNNPLSFGNLSPKPKKRKNKHGKKSVFDGFSIFDNPFSFSFGDGISTSMKNKKSHVNTGDFGFSPGFGFFNSTPKEYFLTRSIDKEGLVKIEVTSNDSPFSGLGNFSAFPSLLNLSNSFQAPDIIKNMMDIQRLRKKYHLSDLIPNEYINEENLRNKKFRSKLDNKFIVKLDNGDIISKKDWDDLLFYDRDLIKYGFENEETLKKRSAKEIKENLQRYGELYHPNIKLKAGNPQNNKAPIKPNPIFEDISRGAWDVLGLAGYFGATYLIAPELIPESIYHTPEFTEWWDELYDYDLSAKIFGVEPKGYQKGGYTGNEMGIAHPFEMVMNPAATQRYFSVLDKMNKEGRGERFGASSFSYSLPSIPNLKKLEKIGWAGWYGPSLAGLGALAYYSPQSLEKIMQGVDYVKNNREKIAESIQETLLHFEAEMLSPGSEIFMIPEMQYKIPSLENIILEKKREEYLEKIERESQKINGGLVYDKNLKRFRKPSTKQVYPGAGEEGVDYKSVVGGKFFEKGGYTGSTGGIVDPYEMVMNPAATQKFFPLLEQMNLEGRGETFGLKSFSLPGMESQIKVYPGFDNNSMTVQSSSFDTNNNFNNINGENGDSGSYTTNSGDKIYLNFNVTQGLEVALAGPLHPRVIVG